MINGMTLQSDILETALNASVVRNDVTLNNIANADTPGFKKKGVVFENFLQNALNSAKLTGRLDLNSLKPQIKLINEGFNYRIDENNVDMDVEMVELYKNSVKYDTMIQSVSNNYKRINLVVRAR